MNIEETPNCTVYRTEIVASRIIEPNRATTFKIQSSDRASINRLVSCFVQHEFRRGHSVGLN